MMSRINEEVPHYYHWAMAQMWHKVANNNNKYKENIAPEECTQVVQFYGSESRIPNLRNIKFELCNQLSKWNENTAVNGAGLNFFIFYGTSKPTNHLALFKNWIVQWKL